VDLTPRTTDEVVPRPRRRRRWIPILVLVGVLVAGVVVVTQFLTSAIDYYCNVDEIGVREGCDADRRLRVQGTVDAGSVSSASGATLFTVSFNGATLPVRYEGEPGGIFDECIPVVVHGRLVGDTFEGDRIEVKHSNEYEEENPDRVGADGSCPG
jgi:cytochrome c-type biogenesis protein CcmE